MNIWRTIREEVGDYAGPAASDRGKTVSFPALFADVETLAATLGNAGIKRQSRVAVLGDDSYEYIALSLAVLALDAAILPFSSRAPENEILAMADRTEAEFILHAGAYAFAGGSPLALPRNCRDVWCLKATGRTPHPIEFRDGEIPAFIRFSSGTTGQNKGVVLSHKTVIERTGACRDLEVRRDETVFWVLDMAFHFVVTILLFLRQGAHTAICPHPVEANLAKTIAEFPPELLYATPYHYRLMTASAELSKDALARVRRAFSTAMKLEVGDAAAFRAKFGVPLTQAYGIIEIGLPCVNRSDRADKAASVGRLQAAYKIDLADRDDSGAGRVRIAGPGIFDAYLSPFRTREEICPDGFFDTGDIGRIDEDGFLFIVGRAKNLINFAGMKIFPYEVEAVLNAFPGVAESRVSGKAYPGFGEIPVAEIVFDGVLDAKKITLLRSKCYAELAAYKVPKTFTQVASLPKTASGKLKRNP